MLRRGGPGGPGFGQAATAGQSRRHAAAEARRRQVRTAPRRAAQRRDLARFPRLPCQQVGDVRK
jgi:hypothetical protein